MSVQPTLAVTSAQAPNRPPLPPRVAGPTLDGRLRPAALRDVPAMQALINDWAARGLMLPRPAGELYEHIRDFVVFDAEPGGVAGCVAMYVVNGRIGEVKSLAVAEAARGRQVGRRLVDAAVAAAADLGLERVFCLTYQAEFFTRCGFVPVDRARLPEKVWGECVRCDKFLSCDEIAMWRPVRDSAPAG